MELQQPGSQQKYVLRLYVAGESPRSMTAIARMRKICNEELKGAYKLEIIDVFERPQMAEDERIVATPTLIKELPPPLRRIVGDLTDEKQILIGLDLQPPG